jgi:hypothetical protein
MKITLGQINDSFPVLHQLYHQPLGVKLKYKLGRVYEHCRKELQRFNDQHLELIKLYGGVEGDIDRPDGSKEPGWKVPDENIKDFEPEFEKLRLIEVEVYGQPIPLSEFEAAETLICKNCNAVLARQTPELRGDISKLFWLFADE